MLTETLRHIPFQPNLTLLMKHLHIKEHTPYAGRFAELAGQAQAIAQPKALYRLAFVEARGDDWVRVDGVRLTSRVLRVNLEHAHRLFAFVATCGVELADWAAGWDDLLERYWAEALCEAALYAALRRLEERVEERYQPGRTAVMTPGSLPDWPLQEQRPLFTLLGDPASAIGVRLSESMLMQPIKSISGIRFPTQEEFASCQLCPRERCPGRRASYQEGLYEAKYRSPGQIRPHQPDCP